MNEIDKLEEAVNSDINLFYYRYDILHLIQSYRRVVEEMAELETQLRLRGIEPKELVREKVPASQRAN